MAGRPSKITKEVLEKLEQAFLQGLSDEEACLLAEIDPKTLYNYCHKHPNFSSKKELLKERPKMLAKVNINKELEAGNIDVSKWFLERRAKDEFSTKQEVTNQIGIDKNDTLNELAKNIRQILSPKPSSNPQS